MNKQANIIQRLISSGQSELPTPPPPPPALPTANEKEIFPMTDQLLQVTPFYSSLSQHKSGHTDGELDDLLRQTIEDIEAKQADFSHIHLPDTLHIKKEIKTELYEEEAFGRRSVSLIAGPDMPLTIEENQILDQLRREQTTASKSCCPVRSGMLGFSREIDSYFQFVPG